VSDIVERLRAWVHAVDAVSASDLMDEAAAEIERLRQVLERKNLTDAERCAITEASEFYIGTRVGATLSRLLSRTGSIAAKTGDDASDRHANREKLPERERLTDAEREAAWHFAIRDKFASAALTGLLSSLPNGDQYHSFAVEKAWSLADAMLRERVRKNTSNDAGPQD